MEGDAGSAGEGGDRPAAVADQMVARRDDSGKRCAYGSPVDLRQDRVEGRALPVAGDENRDIVLIGTRMTGRSAPLARLSRQIGPAALEGFEDKGLIRLDDSAQRSRLVVGERAQKPMSPAERRRRMHPAKLGRLGQAFAFDHRPGVVEPTLPFVQMRHRRLGERIEGAPAALAAEPQQPVRATPADDLAAGAVRTSLSLDPLKTRRSKRVLPTPPLARPSP